MHIMFYKHGKPYKTPNDAGIDDGETIDFNDTAIANIDPPEVDARYITVYTEGGYFYLTLDENDLYRMSSAMWKTFDARKKIYAAVDHLLDAIDADGGDNENVEIVIVANKFDESDHDMQHTEGRYTVEFNTGQTGDETKMHVDFIDYLAGVKVNESSRDLDYDD